MKPTLARVSCILGIIRTEKHEDEEVDKFDKIIIKVEDIPVRLQQTFVSLSAPEGPERGTVLRRTKGSCIATFGSVPFGSYSITAFCGQTGTQIIDANFLSDEGGRYTFANVEPEEKPEKEGWGAFGPSEFASESELEVPKFLDLFRTP